MLVCPVTKTRLIYNSNNQELISPAARLVFPISDGIALLCVEEAHELKDKEYDTLKL